MFEAILEFGWNNIRHYILFDNLTEDEAKFYEAMFIYGWKTYRKSNGYNIVIPKINGVDNINCPTFRECHKQRIVDIYAGNTKDRLEKICASQLNRTKRVQCVTTGEIFDSALDAAIMHGNGHRQSILMAIRGNYPSGTCWIDDDECGTIEVPAYWTYID